MDPDPPRAAEPLDHEGRRLPDARHGADDRCSASSSCAGKTLEPPADGRRADLRDRAGAGRGAGTADEGDRTLVPVRRDADDLHLGREHARLHPAAAHRRDVARHSGLGHLRRDVVALGDARARAADVRLHARRGHPLERAGALLQELDSRGAEADAAADRAARDPRPVHAAHLAERQALREHARGAHPDPDLPRPDVHPRVRRALGARGPRRDRSSTSSRSSSSSRSRRSSSLPCPPSTSARRSSRSTKEETHALQHSSPRPRGRARRPARRSASRSASASARSAPASASATSSAR